MQDILGDYVTFFQNLKNRLNDMGIDFKGRPISHLAFRTATLDDYFTVRDQIEAYSRANVENKWNGRRISKLLLKTPLDLGDGFSTSLIELIPPVHQDDYPMGLEHFGIVYGGDFKQFLMEHADHFTNQQDQGPFCQPRYIRFDDIRMMVKFYEFGLQEVVEKEGRTFDGFYHV